MAQSAAQSISLTSRITTKFDPDGNTVESRSSATAEGNLSFAVTIPAGSTIHSATLYFTLDKTTTWGGTAKVNGITYNNSGSYSQALGAVGSHTAAFYWKSKSSSDGGPYTKTVDQTISWANCYIDVTYTPPTAPSVSGVKLGGSTAAQYRGAGAGIALSFSASNGTNNAITYYAIQYSDNGGAWAWYSDVSGACTVYAHPTAGNYRQFRVIAVAPYGNSEPAYSPVLYTYSVPSAPTSTSVSPSTVYPGDAATLSWSGASNGVGVGISGYNIYEDGAYKAYTTGNTYAFNAPAAGTHKYKIISIGKVSGYNSGDGPEATLTVNNPKSTGTLDKTTVPMDDASQIKITITPAGDYTHKAVWYTPGGTEIVHDVSGTEDTLTVPKNWCSYFPNTTTATNLGKCRLETYSGETKVGEVVYSFTLTVPEDVVPTVSLELIPVDAFGDYYLKGISKVTLDDNATGAYGSSIIAHSMYGGGYSGNTDPFTTGVLLVAGDAIMTATVTDSRYRQATAQKTVTVTNYNNPVISSVAAVRCDEDGTENLDGVYAKINALLTITALTGNSITLAKVEYKKSGDAEWTLVSGALSSGVDKIIGGALAINTAYDIKITLKDTVGKETPGLYQAIIPPAVRAWDFRNDRASLGRIAGEAKTLMLPDDWTTNLNADKLDGYHASDFAAATHNHSAADITSGTLPVARGGTGVTTTKDIALLSYPIGAIYQSAVSTSPATLFGGTWAAIGAGIFLVAAGAGYEAGTTGGEASHILTEAEIAQHHHNGLYWSDFSNGVGFGNTGSPIATIQLTSTPSIAQNAFLTGEAGSNNAHENRPPYYAVYTWRRTA